MSGKHTKLLALAAVLLMAAAIFAGCGISRQAQTTAAQAGQPSGSRSGQKTSASVDALKEVTLRIYFPSEKKAETDDVWNAIAAQYKDRLNASFEVNFISFNDYPDKLMVMEASGDNYDMNFDGNWLAYPKLVNAGAYLPLNGLLPKYAPNIYASLQKAGSLPAAEASGKILCIPWSMKMNQERQFPHWRQDIAQRYGLNYATDSIKTIEDLDVFLRTAKHVIPSNMKIFGWDSDDLGSIARTLLQRDEMNILEFHNFCVSIKDSRCTLIPIEQTKAFRDAAKYAKEWADEGILPKDLMVDKEQISAAYRNGTVFASNGTHEWAFANPGFADPSWKQAESQLYPDRMSVNRSPLANVTCLSKNAANPERALMFLDLLSTDQSLFDMVMYGIRDKTYVLDGDAAVYPKGMTPANSTYLDWQGQWAWWSPNLMRPTTTYTKGFWQTEASFASSSVNVNSPLDGLFFNTDNIKNEIAKRDQLNTEKGKLIQYGLVSNSDQAVDEYIQAQKAAGLDKILAGLQKQIDTYLASIKQ